MVDAGEKEKSSDRCASHQPWYTSGSWMHVWVLTNLSVGLLCQERWIWTFASVSEMRDAWNWLWKHLIHSCICEQESGIFEGDCWRWRGKYVIFWAKESKELFSNTICRPRSCVRFDHGCSRKNCSKHESRWMTRACHTLLFLNHASYPAHTSQNNPSSTSSSNIQCDKTAISFGFSSKNSCPSNVFPARQ